MKKGFILFLLIGWILGCSFWYACIIRDNCGCNKKEVAFNTPNYSLSDGSLNLQMNENFTFDLNTDTENIPNSTALEFNKLSSHLSSGLRTTNITGLYTSEESEQIGLARAEKIKTLLVSKGGIDSLITTSAELDNQLIINKNKVYGAINFSFNQNELKAKELLVSGTAVHFISGSNDLEMTDEITTYMTNLEEYFKQETHTERILLVGHTDATGDRLANIALSKQRAEDVKTNLVAHGISADIIDTEGKGPDVPTADNSTEEGKAQNRRVEIRITE